MASVYVFDSQIKALLECMEYFGSCDLSGFFVQCKLYISTSVDFANMDLLVEHTVRSLVECSDDGCICWSTPVGLAANDIIDLKLYLRV